MESNDYRSASLKLRHLSLLSVCKPLLVVGRCVIVTLNVPKMFVNRKHFGSFPHHERHPTVVVMNYTTFEMFYTIFVIKYMQVLLLLFISPIKSFA